MASGFTSQHNQRNPMKTIPHILTKSLGASMCLATFAVSAIHADAQHRRGIPRGGGGVAPPAEQGVDFGKLGVLQDKFAAYQRLTFGGAGFYTKGDSRLRKAHTKTYQLIRNSLIEDRISEEEGRNATGVLLAIGAEAKRLRGDADALGEEDAALIGTKITALAKRIREARTNKTDPGILTPRINRRQVHMEEILLFAIDSKIASKGQAATLRRHLDSLEKKEDRAKGDRKVSDRERENLVQETHEVWKAFVRILKP